MWVLTNVIIALDFMPKGHPWRRKFLTLESWVQAGTLFCWEISCVMWVNFILFIGLWILLFLGHKS